MIASMMIKFLECQPGKHTGPRC